MTKTSVVERIPDGSVVRVIDDSAVEYDVPKGSEWVIEYYETAVDYDGKGDDAMEFYGLEPLPGSGSAGTWAAPCSSVRMIRTAEEQAELMRMPTVDEIAVLISDGLIQASDDGWEVFETELEKRLPGDEAAPFEEPNEFSAGVTFYARRRGGRGFGAVVRITGFWPIDD